MERQRPSEGQWSTGSGSGGRRSQKGKEGPTFVWIATADLPPTATPTAFPRPDNAPFGFMTDDVMSEALMSEAEPIDNRRPSFRTVLRGLQCAFHSQKANDGAVHVGPGLVLRNRQWGYATQQVRARDPGIEESRHRGIWQALGKTQMGHG
ncbi:hypothetical protein E4U54_007054, partial [Claviceps lovelessii]